MFEIHDVVALTENIDSDGLLAGQTGAIIIIHGDPADAYEVEFVDQEGQTKAVVVVSPSQIRKA